ncbi:MAG: Fe-S cluster assembly ATPase SufC [Solirubrobacterales bacterium]
MAELEIRNLHVKIEEKQILKGLDLDVEKGRVHALMGPNGSGKSTLANVIMGHPAYEVTEGTITFKGEDITEAAPEERSQAGLFMAFQYPVAIPGVSVSKYLRMIINAHREARGEDQIKIKDFAKTAQEAMELANIPKDFSSRYLNDGFSGGEKKRMELLQLALLRPEIAVLDETDSGLDIDALRTGRRRRQQVQRPRHGRPHHHPLPADPQHGEAGPGLDHVRGPDRQGGRPGAGRHPGGERLRLDPRGGRGGRRRLAPRRGMEQATAKGTGATGAFPIERVRAQFPLLEREVNGVPVAYLDSGASSERVLASIEAVDEYERRHHSNVHRGSHTLSAEATEAYEGARSTVARHLGAADRREVIFVRNATEAINLVARAWGDANVGAGDRILLTEMEHHSNLVPWQQLAERVGATVDFAPIDDEGLLDLEALRALLERGPKLLAITHVSNVLGTENPLAEISAMAHEAGALVLADGAQSAPKLPLDMAELGVDFYAITGHKFYGPTGIGALWGRLDLLRAMPPFLGGGSMIRKVSRDGTTYADVPARFEAGTPAIAQAIGMAAALDWLDGELGMEAVRDHERAIADYTLARLAEVPGLQVFGPPRGPERLGPVSFELDGIHAHDVSEILDRHGVAVRAGHHCAQILMERLGVTATARASFGVYTTTEEIDRLVTGLEDARQVFGL